MLPQSITTSREGKDEFGATVDTNGVPIVSTKEELGGPDGPPDSPCMQLAGDGAPASQSLELRGGHFPSLCE